MATKKHKDAIKIFEIFNYTCQYCSRQFSPEQPPLQIHHRVFKGRGKTHKIYDKPDNLVPACNDCHNSGNHAFLKGAKLYTEEDFSVIEKLEEFYRNFKK